MVLIIRMFVFVVPLVMPALLLGNSLPVVAKYQNVINEMQKIHGRFPKKSNLRTLGFSLEGREINIIELGNYDADEKIYLNAAHHGDEHISATSLLAVIRYFLENKNDPSVQMVLHRFHIIAHPIVNPDGFVRGSRFDSLGRDPNRDYAHPNKHESESFRLPEIRLVRSLMAKYRFAGAISFHSGSEGILWPWCYSKQQNPDQKNFSKLARKSAIAMGQSFFSQSYFDYHTSGEFIDYAYMKYRTLALTFELSHQHDVSEVAKEKIFQRTIDGVVTYMMELSDTISQNPST